VIECRGLQIPNRPPWATATIPSKRNLPGQSDYETCSVNCFRLNEYLSQQMPNKAQAVVRKLKQLEKLFHLRAEEISKYIEIRLQAFLTSSVLKH